MKFFRVLAYHNTVLVTPERNFQDRTDFSVILVKNVKIPFSFAVSRNYKVIFCRKNLESPDSGNISRLPVKSFVFLPKQDSKGWIEFHRNYDNFWPPLFSQTPHVASFVSLHAPVTLAFQSGQRQDGCWKKITDLGLYLLIHNRVRAAIFPDFSGNVSKLFPQLCVIKNHKSHVG